MRPVRTVGEGFIEVCAVENVVVGIRRIVLGEHPDFSARIVGAVEDVLLIDPLRRRLSLDRRSDCLDDVLDQTAGGCQMRIQTETAVVLRIESPMEARMLPLDFGDRRGRHFISDPVEEHAAGIAPEVGRP